MSEIVSNRAIEDAAIAFVLTFERQAGRSAQDTRGRGAPADVESGSRLIEVKAFGTDARGKDLWLEPPQVEEARHNPDFHLYLVENVRQGDPNQFRLIDLHGERLARLIERSRERRYYIVPLPVAVYDEAASESDHARTIGPGLSGMQHGPTADFGDSD